MGDRFFIELFIFSGGIALKPAIKKDPYI